MKDWKRAVMVDTGGLPRATQVHLVGVNWGTLAGRPRPCPSAVFRRRGGGDFQERILGTDRLGDPQPVVRVSLLHDLLPGTWTIQNEKILG